MGKQDIYFVVKGVREINGKKWIEIHEQTADGLLKYGEKDIFILKADNGEYFWDRIETPEQITDKKHYEPIVIDAPTLQQYKPNAVRLQLDILVFIDEYADEDPNYRPIYKMLEDVRRDLENEVRNIFAGDGLFGVDHPYYDLRDVLLKVKSEIIQ